MSKILLILGAIVLAGASFYGGVAYRAAGSPTILIPPPPEAANAPTPQASVTPPLSTFTGKITAASAESITLKFQDGSSKTFSIFDSIRITKPATVADLEVGALVVVAPDGTTAKLVQVLPPLSVSAPAP